MFALFRNPYESIPVNISQLIFTCSKSTIEKIERGVKCFQS